VATDAPLEKSTTECAEAKRTLRDARDEADAGEVLSLVCDTGALIGLGELSWKHAIGSDRLDRNRISRTPAGVQQMGNGLETIPLVIRPTLNNYVSR
jgi:hypothetical protein